MSWLYFCTISMLRGKRAIMFCLPPAASWQLALQREGREEGQGVSE